VFFTYITLKLILLGDTRVCEWFVQHLSSAHLVSGSLNNSRHTRGRRHNYHDRRHLHHEPDERVGVPVTLYFVFRISPFWSSSMLLCAFPSFSVRIPSWCLEVNRYRLLPNCCVFTVANRLPSSLYGDFIGSDSRVKRFFRRSLWSKEEPSVEAASISLWPSGSDKIFRQICMKFGMGIHLQNVVQRKLVSWKSTH
jgi:hypothetical protein